MKKFFAVMLTVIFMSTNAFALLDPTANVNTNTNAALAGAVAGAVSGSASNSNAVSLQGQTQSASNSNDNSNGVSVSGDKNKTFAYGHSSAGVAKGTESVSVGSIFGGISWSDDNQLTKLESRYASLKTIGALTVDDETELAHDIKLATKMPRYLGLFKVSGRKHLLNLFGILLF